MAAAFFEESGVSSMESLEDAIESDSLIPVGEEYLFLHSAIYALGCVLLIWPPDEFVSAGFTFETFVWRYLGDPLVNVLDYQARKIIVNRAFVLSLPSLYAAWIAYHYNLATHPLLHGYVVVATALCVGAASYLAFHHLTGFTQLTSIKRLQRYGENLASTMRTCASEYKDFNNFSCQHAHSKKFVASTNWLYSIGRYGFDVVKTRDVTLEVVTSRTHEINPEARNGLQMLVVEAKPAEGVTGIAKFSFRIRAEQLDGLREKTGQPIPLRTNVEMRQSLTESFVEVFKEFIASNPRQRYSGVSDLDPCFGCSSSQPEVRIAVRCDRFVEGQPRCRPCACRPQWCASCLARVFASKQNEDRPEGWMDGQATCPTCRAEFCPVDVAYIDNY